MIFQVQRRKGKRGKNVGIVRGDDAAVLGDGDVANVVVAGGHGAVDGFLPGDFHNGGNERLARGSVQVHFRCHDNFHAGAAPAWKLS